MTAIVTQKKPSPKRLTTEQFIARSIDAHGPDRYGYHESVYEGSGRLIKIYCNQCRRFFTQRAGKHMRGEGCATCAGHKKLTTEQWKQKAVDVHGADRYCYDLVVYEGSSKPVEIICNVCGCRFWQEANSHLCGHGCAKCKGVAKLTTEEFVLRSKETQGDKFDYSLAVYVDAETKVWLTCNDCGYVFEQYPSSHMRGIGCARCAGKEKLTKEKFVELANSIYLGKCDYTDSIYVNYHTKLWIKCNECGCNFEKTPAKHLGGQGCPECGKKAGNLKRTGTLEDFIKDALVEHGDKYLYTNSVYVNSNTPLLIYCKKCKIEFSKTPGKHLAGQGCPLCAQELSNSAGIRCVKTTLDNLGISYVTEHRFDDCRHKKPLPFDVFLPKQNICIEFQGQQHFFDLDFFGGSDGLIDRQRNDNIKRGWCASNGIKLIEIRYDCKDIAVELCQQLGIYQMPLALR